MASIKTKLSAAVLGLVMAGAPASIILSQFLDEKEGNRLVAYPDGKGIWTICRGATQVDGKPVVKGMKLSAEKCAAVNKLEADKAINWVKKNARVPLTEPQIAVSRRFAPITSARVNVSPPRSIKNSTLATVKVHALKSNAGYMTAARIAIFAQITVTGR
ncbi:lysozyme [Yersinia enterocolitica]|uniref:lysozyme n=1 Tax=Yersinia enterocolitica TaxID=630 RepID=UPI003D7A9684